MTSDSDDEFEESYAEDYTHDPILVPKDSYVVRPLPFRIGSAAFKEEEDVGLGDYASDSEGEPLSLAGSIALETPLILRVSPSR